LEERNELIRGKEETLKVLKAEKESLEERTCQVQKEAERERSRLGERLGENFLNDIYISRPASARIFQAIWRELKSSCSNPRLAFRPWWKSWSAN